MRKRLLRWLTVGGVMVLIAGGLATIQGIWNLFSNEPFSAYVTKTIPLWPRIILLVVYCAITIIGVVLVIKVFRQTRESIAEPEIRIQIDDFSWGNPTTIENQLGRIIEVALTLYMKKPPINVTDLQLYIENGKQKLVASNPTIPFTQENKKGRYLARFGFSYSNPGFVITNDVKKHQLRVMAMGRVWTSKEFSPKDFRQCIPE